MSAQFTELGVILGLESDDLRLMSLVHQCESVRNAVVFDLLNDKSLPEGAKEYLRQRYAGTPYEAEVKPELQKIPESLQDWGERLIEMSGRLWDLIEPNVLRIIDSSARQETGLAQVYELLKRVAWDEYEVLARQVEQKTRSNDSSHVITVEDQKRKLESQFDQAIWNKLYSAKLRSRSFAEGLWPDNARSVLSQSATRGRRGPRTNREKAILIRDAVRRVVASEEDWKSHYKEVVEEFHRSSVPFPPNWKVDGFESWEDAVEEKTCRSYVDYWLKKAKDCK
ncbi:MAG: hypothetical protein HY820_44725 [Acidobacteria bacterium]|nr:hypothetical protein [Acidobacteriota bacterium]